MRIYRAKPIAWTDSSVALLNEYGATLCTPDREATPLDLPEADGKEKTPPNPPLLPPTLSLVKIPVKNTVGAVSHAGPKSARMERKENYERRYFHAYSRCERRFFLPEVPGA